MSPDEELMLIFGAMHLVALLFGGVLFVMFLRSDTVAPYREGDDEDGSGGGGNDRTGRDRPEKPSGGGIPLPDAEPSPVRLRGDHERLADVHRRERRPAREPAPGPRVPSP